MSHVPSPLLSNWPTPSTHAARRAVRLRKQCRHRWATGQIGPGLRRVAQRSSYYSSHHKREAKMREPEMVGPEAGAVSSRGRAVAGRYPTALTVDGFPTPTPCTGSIARAGPASETFAPSTRNGEVRPNSSSRYGGCGPQRITRARYAARRLKGREDRSAERRNGRAAENGPRRRCIGRLQARQSVGAGGADEGR